MAGLLRKLGSVVFALGVPVIVVVLLFRPDYSPGAGRLGCWMTSLQLEWFVLGVGLGLVLTLRLWKMKLRRDADRRAIARMRARVGGIDRYR